MMESDQSDANVAVKDILKPNLNNPKNAVLEQIKSFVAGGVGGICAVITGHPFDLIKVRMQTASPGTYLSSIDAVKKTISKDGALGLYRGVSAPLAGVTPMFAVSFWGYGLGKQLVTIGQSDKNNLSIAQVSAAGFFSAIPTTAIAAPFERVKVLLQIQGQQFQSESAQNVKSSGTSTSTSNSTVKNNSKSAPTQKYNGSWDVVKSLYKTGGLKSVFKGSGATLARDGPGSALYFATYEYFKRTLTPKQDLISNEQQPISLLSIMFAGGMAGVAMWVGVFPVDTVKSVLQSSEEKMSISQAFKKVYASGGVKAFFPGIGPALARSFPANAATFLGVELTHKLFEAL